MKIKTIVYVFISACMVCLLAGIHPASADISVDGTLWGDEDEYTLLAEVPDRGRLYFKRDGGMLYLLMEVDHSVNDNVIGDRSLDQEYLASVGWSRHDLWALVASDHMIGILSCGDIYYEWRHDYAYDTDGDTDPHEADWLSGPLGPDGGGTPPPGLITASSFQWNLNNTLWDVTLGGTRTDRRSYKSPDPIVNYPGYDPDLAWAWPVSYEMAIDVSFCECETQIVSVATAHNSPSKSGEPDVIIDASFVDPIQAIGAVGHGGSACEGEPVMLDGSESWGCDDAGMEYRWSLGATVLCDWSPEPTCEIVPPGTGDYTLEVRCVHDTNCESSGSVAVVLAPAPIADLAAPDLICTNDEIVLDATASSAVDCPVPLEYQFRDQNGIIQEWGTAATLGPFAPPAGGGTYSVYVRCGDCETSTSHTIGVMDPPLAVVGPDFVDDCYPVYVTLDASASEALDCPGELLFEWWDGSTLVRPADPDPTWSPPPYLGTKVYTVRVMCSSLPECAASHDVTVIQTDCSTPVAFSTLDAILSKTSDGSVILVRWSAILESDTLFYLVERGADRTGPFAVIGAPVLARGGGNSYLFVDDSHQSRDLPWYRIVEYTSKGRGDTSIAFQAEAGQPEGKGISRGRHRRQHSR